MCMHTVEITQQLLLSSIWHKASVQLALSYKNFSFNYGTYRYYQQGLGCNSWRIKCSL